MNPCRPEFSFSLSSKHILEEKQRLCTLTLIASIPRGYGYKDSFSFQFGQYFILTDTYVCGVVNFSKLYSPLSTYSHVPESL